MKPFLKLSLKRRLIGGFLLCALLTGLSGGSGIYSLKQIMGRMTRNTVVVHENIDNQYRQIKHLMPVRAILTDITNAHDLETLKRIDGAFQELMQSTPESKNEPNEIFNKTMNLFQHKHDQVKALDTLGNMIRKNVELLDNISQLVAHSVDQSEEEAVNIIEKNLKEIKHEFVTLVTREGNSISNEDGVQALFKNSGMNAKMDDLVMSSEMSVSSVIAALLIQSNSNKQLAIIKTIYTMDDHSELDEAEKQIEFIQRRINSDMVELPENETTEQISKRHLLFKAGLKDIIRQKHLEIEASKDLKMVTAEILKDMRRVEESLLEDGQKMKHDVADTMASSARVIGKWQYTQLALVVVSILIAVFIGGIVARSINRPIDRIVTMLKDIAAGGGDLTMRLDQTKQDEMGEMAQWFNQFIMKIQGIIQGIVSDSGTLSTSSANLSELFAHINREIRRFDEHSGKILSQSKKMNLDIAAIDEAISRISNDINAVTRASQEMIVTIKDIAESTKKTSEMTGDAVSQAEQASNQIGTLGHMVKKIGHITDVINEISNQINLLALNATIESPCPAIPWPWPRVLPRCRS